MVCSLSAGQEGVEDKITPEYRLRDKKPKQNKKKEKKIPIFRRKNLNEKKGKTKKPKRKAEQEGIHRRRQLISETRCIDPFYCRKHRQLTEQNVVRAYGDNVGTTCEAGLATIPRRCPIPYKGGLKHSRCGMRETHWLQRAFKVDKLRILNCTIWEKCWHQLSWS